MSGLRSLRRAEKRRERERERERMMSSYRRILFSMKSPKHSINEAIFGMIAVRIICERFFISSLLAAVPNSLYRAWSLSLSLSLYLSVSLSLSLSLSLLFSALRRLRSPDMKSFEEFH